MTTVCTLALDAERTCDAPAVETWHEYGDDFGLCREHGGRVTVDVAPDQVVVLPAGLPVERRRWLWGDLPDKPFVSQSHGGVRARLVHYDGETGTAVIDYALGGCGSFARVAGVRLELEGVELPSGQAPSYVRCPERGYDVCAHLAVRDGQVVAVPAPPLFRDPAAV